MRAIRNLIRNGLARLPDGLARKANDTLFVEGANRHEGIVGLSSLMASQP